jgi:hypothetical protein
MARNDPVEISCHVVHQTDVAVLINDGTGEHWIPKKLISDPHEDDIVTGSDTEIFIPEWLAMEKGLI